MLNSTSPSNTQPARPWSCIVMDLNVRLGPLHYTHTHPGERTQPLAYTWYPFPTGRTEHRQKDFLSVSPPPRKGTQNLPWWAKCVDHHTKELCVCVHTCIHKCLWIFTIEENREWIEKYRKTILQPMDQILRAITIWTTRENKYTWNLLP